MVNNGTFPSTYTSPMGYYNPWPYQPSWPSYPYNPWTCPSCNRCPSCGQVRTPTWVTKTTTTANPAWVGTLAAGGGSLMTDMNTDALKSQAVLMNCAEDCSHDD